MSKLPKLMILSPRFPYPLEKGDKLRLYNQINILHKEFQLHLIALSEVEIDKNSYEKIDLLCESIHVLKQSSLYIYNYQNDSF